MLCQTYQRIHQKFSQLDAEMLDEVEKREQIYSNISKTLPLLYTNEICSSEMLTNFFAFTKNDCTTCFVFVFIDGKIHFNAIQRFIVCVHEEKKKSRPVFFVIIVILKRDRYRSTYFRRGNLSFCT